MNIASALRQVQPASSTTTRASAPARRYLPDSTSNRGHQKDQHGIAGPGRQAHAITRVEKAEQGIAQQQDASKHQELALALLEAPTGEHDDAGARGGQRRRDLNPLPGRCGAGAQGEWMKSNVPPRGSENSTVMRFAMTL